MKRRNFIQSITAGLSSFPFLTKQQEPSSNLLRQFQLDLDEAGGDADYWQIVRDAFELSPNIVHLNCGSIGASAKIVTNALVEYSREIENDPYMHVFGDGLHQKLESVRELAAGLINAIREEVAITRNTTEGMNIVSRGLDLKPGDEVLTTNHEHAGGMACWQYLAKRIGVKVVTLNLPGTVMDSDQVMEQLVKHISPRTRVFSFCHVDTLTGFVMPIAAISQEAKQRGIFFVCDGAQAPGMLNVDVKQLGVDAYVSSSHKWMLAPKGSGLLYIDKLAQPHIQSLELSSGLNVYSASFGTRNVAQILGHGVAIRFHQSIGADKIEQRIRQLNQYLGDQLAQIKSLQRLTSENPECSSGIVTFAIDRNVASSSEVANRLRADSKIYVKPVPPTFALVPDAVDRQEDYNALRFSTHIFNSEEQIDRAVAAISELLENR